MSRKITLPLNQVRLTNVAIVRLNRCGKRFEIACYKNKVMNYRQKLENDLSEVLQTFRVFADVSRGNFSSASDLKQAFHTVNQEEICQLILTSGIIQSSEMERSIGLENMYREISSMVSNKCVHPETNRPYSVHQIRVAMNEANYNIRPQNNRSIKQHFLDCVRTLQDSATLNITRARMELAVFVQDNKKNSRLKILLNKLHDNCHSVRIESLSKIILQIDPGKYKIVQYTCKELPGRLEILKQIVISTDETSNSSVITGNGDCHKNYTYGCTSNEKKMSTNKFSIMQDSLHFDRKDEHNLTLINGDIYSCLNYCNQELLLPMNNKSMESKGTQAERPSMPKPRKINSNKLMKSESFSTRTPYKFQTGNVFSKSTEKENMCTTCRVSLIPSQFRPHFRSKWHLNNVKLKMKGLPPLHESDFKGPN